MRWLIALCIWARCRGSRGTSCRRRTGLWEGILQVSGKFFRRLYSGRVLPLSLCTLHAPLELTCGTCGSAQTAIDSSCPSLDKLPSNPPPSPLRRLNLSSIYLIPSPPSCPMGRASVCASCEMLPRVWGGETLILATVSLSQQRIVRCRSISLLISLIPSPLGSPMGRASVCASCEMLPRVWGGETLILATV